MARKKPPPRVAELRKLVTTSPRNEELNAVAQGVFRQLSLIDPVHIIVDSSGTDSWCTPPELYEPVLEFLGVKAFDLDPCSNEHSTVPARKMFTAAHDGLGQDWGKAKSIWVNPPYSKPGPWIDLLEAAAQAERFALVKLDTTTKWFQPLWRASALLFLRNRIKFLHQGQRQTSANFPNAMAYWGQNPEAFALSVADLGVVIAPELAASRGSIFRRCVLSN